MKTRIRLSKTQYDEINDLATQVTGYDKSSPIWGKTTLEVAQAIDKLLVPFAGDRDIDEARKLLEALVRRETKSRIVGMQVKDAARRAAKVTP